MGRAATPPFLSALLAGALACTGTMHAARVPLASAEASYGEYASQRVPLVIDGHDTSRFGWSVFPRTADPHTLFVSTSQPVQARAYDLTLCFLSGLPKRYFGNFAVSFTTDPQPTAGGMWQRIPPVRYSATGTTLTLQGDGRLVASGSDSMIGDAIFQLRIEPRQQPITGFRLEVFPFERPDIPGPRVAWGEYKDFCLTEFRIESDNSTSTNIALGQPAKASHALWADLSAGVLTDGLPGSFIHPAAPDAGGEFYYEIDLGTVRDIDHIALRSRADGYAPDRMSRVRLQLFDHPAEVGVTAAWEGLLRADGTHPGPGEVDMIRAAQGRGNGKGRYLRISSDSQVAYSPQLAEVEVYGTLTAHVESARADGNALPFTKGLELPAGTAVLGLALAIPGAGLPERLPLRWRLKGWHDDWQTTDTRTIEIAHVPAGSYRLEAQVGHSDREWDSSVMTLPVVVLRHFWQTPAFHFGIALAGVSIVLVAVQQAARRKEARRQAAARYQAALAEERTRIARDMHDEVGARLSQLALMQDLIVRRHPLPPDTEASLRELAVSTRQTVDALDQVVWAVNPLHDTLAGMAEYLSYTASSYLKPLDITCRFDAPYEWPEVVVRAQTRHQLVLAFREALQNIAKHSGAKNVTLTMRHEPPDFMVLLSDDGRGLPTDPAGPGKEGIANMKSRLAAIGGTCTLRTREAGGTEVELRAPLHAATL